MVEKVCERIVEPLRLLHVRHVTSAWNEHQLGACDVAVHLLAERRRRQRVLIADEDLDRTMDRRQRRRRIGPGHESSQRARDCLDRIADDLAAQVLDHVRPPAPRRVADELGQQRVRDRRLPFLARRAAACSSARPPPRANRPATWCPRGSSPENTWAPGGTSRKRRSRPWTGRRSPRAWMCSASSRSIRCPRVVVNGCRRRIAGAVTETTELRPG